MTQRPVAQQQNDLSGWTGVWSRIRYVDAGRVAGQGHGRTMIERTGNDVARVAVGAQFTDEPAVQQMLLEMSLVLPYLPFDRSGFILAAAAALGGRDDAPDTTGAALERLHGDLVQTNLRHVESSFAAAQLEADRRDQATARRDAEQTAEAPVRSAADESSAVEAPVGGLDYEERYRLLVRALGDLSRSVDQGNAARFDGEEATYLGNIAGRLSQQLKLSEQLRKVHRRLQKAEQENHQLSETLKQLQKKAARSRPKPVMLTSWQQAEKHAARWMHYLGYDDAEVTPTGPDGGIDVVAGKAIAQVKAEGYQTGSRVVRELAGLTVRGTHRKKDLLFFSSFGYTRDAVTTAEELGVALFRFADKGTAVAVSSAAKRMLEAADRAQAVQG